MNACLVADHNVLRFLKSNLNRDSSISESYIVLSYARLFTFCMPQKLEIPDRTKLCQVKSVKHKSVLWFRKDSLDFSTQMPSTITGMQHWLTLLASGKDTIKYLFFVCFMYGQDFFCLYVLSVWPMYSFISKEGQSKLNQKDIFVLTLKCRFAVGVGFFCIV